MLPYMCTLVTSLRVGLGVAQWVAVPNGLRDGEYDGNLNSLKLLTSFVAMAAYAGIGLHASIYEPLQTKKAANKRDVLRRTSQSGSQAAAPVLPQRGKTQAAAKAGNSKKVFFQGKRKILLMCPASQQNILQGALV